MCIIPAVCEPSDPNVNYEKRYANDKMLRDRSLRRKQLVHSSLASSFSAMKVTSSCTTASVALVCRNSV